MGVWLCIGFFALFDSTVIGINRARLVFLFVLMGCSLTDLNCSSQERFDILCP